MTSAVSHYIILQVNYIITSNNWIRSPSAFKSLIGLVLVSVMIFRLRELVLLLLPLKIRGVLLFCLRGGFFLIPKLWMECDQCDQGPATALNVITSVSQPCWEPKQGLLLPWHLEPKQERGWGCYKAWEKKSNNNNRSKKGFF